MNRFTLLFVFLGLCTIGGVMGAARAYDLKHPSDPYLVVISAVCFFGLLLAARLNAKWREAFDYLADRWRAQSDEVLRMYTLRAEDKKREDEIEGFINCFRPSQAQVDEMLTAEARIVEAACERVKLLYTTGVAGYVSSGDLGGDIIGAKKAFGQDQAIREEEARVALVHFGRRLDMVKQRDYTVLNCWPDYIAAARARPDLVEVPPDERVR